MMSTADLLTSTWDLEPSVIVGCCALMAAYALIAGPITWRWWSFGTGMLILLLALISPLDRLGDIYLFSAHMLQHLLLILAVPPLLLLGLPPAVAARALQRRAVARMEGFLGRPLVAWLIGEGTLWVWHAPPLYEAALLHLGLHIVQHLSFLVSSTMLWWPVIAPLSERHRLTPLLAALYLFAASLASSVLGIILTFAPPGLYPSYVRPLGSAAVVALIRQGWGFSVAADQQLGGLLMWVLSTPVYLLAIAGLLVRWYGEPEDPLIVTPVGTSIAGTTIVAVED